MVVIAGPTASGKTSLALELAKLTPATIINADASQVYADLSVVSARPSDAEMAAAPHRLFGHIDGAVSCSAADWSAQARAEVERCGNDGRLPIIVGGTGLYLRTLLEGIAPVPEIDPAIRAEVRGLPLNVAWQALRNEDPDAAVRLAPADSARICRALEVVRSTGQTLKHWQQQKTGGIGDEVNHVGAVLLPPRDWLHERIDRRFEAMMGDEGVAEVDRLLARQLDPALPVMRAIGVPEIAAYLRGEIDRETAIERGRLATRQYAKRQYTWFRNQSPPHWQCIDAQLNDENVNDLAIKLRQMALTG